MDQKTAFNNSAPPVTLHNLLFLKGCVKQLIRIYLRKKIFESEAESICGGLLFLTSLKRPLFLCEGLFGHDRRGDLNTDKSALQLNVKWLAIADDRH